MADKIERIVDRTIEHTSALLRAAPGGWSVACRGLERIWRELALEAPGHPALDRLEGFIADQERAFRPL